MEDSATMIPMTGTQGFNAGDIVTIQTMRTGFWIRLWYIVFFGYVPMVNKMFTVTQVDDGTTMSLDCMLT